MALVPCLNPRVCGVQSHRSLDNCYGARVSTRGIPSGTPTPIGATVSPAVAAKMTAIESSLSESGFDRAQIDSVMDALDEYAGYQSGRIMSGKSSDSSMTELADLTSDELRDEYIRYLENHVAWLQDPDRNYYFDDLDQRYIDAVEQEIRELGSGIGDDPEIEDFLVTKNALAFSRNAVKGYERETRYLAGSHDLSIEGASALLSDLRSEYIAMSDDEKEQALTDQARSYVESLYRYSKQHKKPPMDDATIYAIWSAETDPSTVNRYPSQHREIVVFDIETTGFRYHQDRICQIGMVVYSPDGEVVRRYSSLIQTERDENGEWYTGELETPDGRPGARAVHKIEPTDLDDAPSWDEVAPEITEIMSGRTLAAHNIFFDYPRIQNALSSSGMDTLDSPPMIDTMRLSKLDLALSGEDGKNGLGVVAERIGIQPETDRLHRADYDAEINGQVLFGLKKRVRSYQPEMVG